LNLDEVATKTSCVLCIGKTPKVFSLGKLARKAATESTMLYLVSSINIFSDRKWTDEWLTSVSTRLGLRQ